MDYLTCSHFRTVFSNVSRGREELNFFSILFVLLLPLPISPQIPILIRQPLLQQLHCHLLPILPCELLECDSMLIGPICVGTVQEVSSDDVGVAISGCDVEWAESNKLTMGGIAVSV